MQTTFALAALASVAYALPQGAATGIAPSSPPPPGCSTNYLSGGQFQVTIYNASTPIAKRQSKCGQDGLLTVTLKNGELVDSAGRIGSIVANRQFQFDGPPPQTGAIYTSGFSVCQNGSLAIGGNNVFYSCNSGGFSNLYDQNVGEQCKPIYINAISCTGGSGSSSGGAATQQPDGQPAATTVGAPPVTQIGDGQPQASTGAAKPPVSQIGDGQVQATTVVAPPVSQIGDGQIQGTAVAAPPVSQIGDGQVQATAVAPPVSQIGDGQVQATSAAAPPVSQIGDGQVQATTAVAPPVSQIGDGQVQATTAVAPPVSQIGDGQVQATATAPKPVSQIPDGQVQANTTAPPAQFVGAASGLNIASSFGALVMGLTAVLLL